MINLFLMTCSDDEKKSKFEELYIIYKKYVYFISLKRLKEFRDGSFVENAFQEIFFKVFCNMEKFDDLNSISTRAYINKISETVISDILKKEIKYMDVTNEGEVYVI